MAMISSPGINFDTVNRTIAQAVTARETSLRNTITEVGSQETPSSVDLLIMQQEIQQWSMMIQIQSTVVKELSDSMKGIIQKSA